MTRLHNIQDVANDLTRELTRAEIDPRSTALPALAAFIREETATILNTLNRRGEGATAGGDSKKLLPFAHAAVKDAARR